jgi:hypothetical protein
LGIARANGADQKRGPNAFTDGCGLISLQNTRIAARRPSCRSKHLLESRMWEICLPGSVGEGDHFLPTPVMLQPLWGDRNGIKAIKFSTDLAGIIDIPEISCNVHKINILDCIDACGGRRGQRQGGDEITSEVRMKRRRYVRAELRDANGRQGYANADRTDAGNIVGGMDENAHCWIMR